MDTSKIIQIMPRKKGFKHSEKTIKNMILNHKGMLGKSQLQETKNKMSLARNKWWQENKDSEKMKERNKKLSLARKKLWKNPEYRNKMKNIRGMLGKIHTIKTKKKMSEAHKRKNLSKESLINIGNAHKGEKSGMWKGDKAGDMALHIWLKKNKSKPLFCEECKEDKKLCLANMKNHNYTRNPKDYKWLCYKCHSKLDFPDGLKGKNLK